MTEYKRADFHIHSSFSDDGLIDPKHILYIAKKRGLKTVAITDHNTIQGGLAARKYAQIVGIQVLVGAEIVTNDGDLIGINLQKEIAFRNWEDVITNIRDQGGLAVLPHPFRGHHEPEKIAREVDFIEVFNSRCTQKQNQDAEHLALKLGKKTIYGSDAHTGMEIGNVMFDFDTELDIILNADRLKYSGSFPIYISQFKKMIKDKNWRGLIRIGATHSVGKFKKLLV